MKQTNLLNTDMVKLSSSFARSTNLAIDYTSTKKLGGIFITPKFEQETIDLLKSILDENSNQRVKVLSGSPGLGKSTFALFAANLISKKNPIIVKRILSSNEGKKRIILEKSFASFQRSKKTKLLPVFLNGYMGDIEDVFIDRLRSSMKDIGLEDEFEKIVKVVSMDQLSIIKKWSKFFPKIYGRYRQMIEEKGERPSSFEKDLRRGKASARELFESVYSDITGGASTASRTKSNIIGLFKKCIRLLHKKGYAGVYVFYDEFGKYLEKGIHNPSLLNVQFLQDFAEYCDRSGKWQCHISLITHLSVSQYASKLPLNIQKEWAKVEGRFHETSFFDRNTNHYKMVGAVFEKTIQDNGKELNAKWKTYIGSLRKKFKNGKVGIDGLFSMENAGEVIGRCYPLHPVVLGLLPDICQKVAQNERTLYTFLTRDEENSLPRFISMGLPKDKLNLLGFRNLYEYFSPLIAKDTGIGGYYKVQLVHEASCNKFDKGDILAKEIISLVALVTIINDSSLAPISKDFIAASLSSEYPKNDIEKKIGELIGKKVLVPNKITKQFEFIEGSSVDIDEEIEKLKTKELTSKDLVKLLKKYVRPSYIVPNKYNFEHHTTRYYRSEIISFEELTKFSSDYRPNYGREDGVLYYVVPFSKDELDQAKAEIKKARNECVAFVLPDTFIECKADLEELNAVNALFANKDIINSGPLVKKELDRHKDILVGSIEKIVRPLLGRTFLKAVCFYPRNDKRLSVKHFGQLNRFLGDIFEAEYKHSVDFNSEYTNKHKVTGNIALARKLLINAIIQNKTLPNLGLEGNKPETAIYKALRRAASTTVKNGRIGLGSRSPLKPGLEEYRRIISAGGGASAEKVIKTFIAPPFGVRKGVLSLLIAVWDQVLEGPVNHYCDQTFVTAVDGDHYDMLLKQPKICQIQYTQISKKMGLYISYIAKAFDKKNIGDVGGLLAAVYLWRKGIPDSTKNSEELDTFSKKFLIHIDSAQDPADLVFGRIPDSFGLKAIGDKTSKKNIEEVAAAVKNAVGCISKIYPELIEELHSLLVDSIRLLQKGCLGEKPFVYSKGMNLAKVFQSTLGRLQQNITNYPFSTKTSRFLGRVRGFDSGKPSWYFVETLADALTDSNPRNWDTKGRSIFQFTLAKAISEIETVSEYLNSDINGESAIAFINKNTGDKNFIKLGTVTDLDDSLLSKVDQIEDILDGLSEKDRKNLLANLLKSSQKNDTLEGQDTLDETRSGI